MPQNRPPQSKWKRISQIPISITGPDGHPLRWQLPTIEVVKDRLWRIYLSARTVQNIVTIYYLDVEPHNGMRIVKQGKTLETNNLLKGEFGHDGVGPSCFYHTDRGPVMALIAMRLDPPIYHACTMFWPQIPQTPQFEHDPEIASFEDRDFAVSPFVLRENGLYHMWYSRGCGWRMDAKPNPEPTYAIAHATSENGLDGWIIEDGFSIPPQNPEETGITRACVQRRTDGDAGWEMWYSYRSLFDPDRPTLRHYKIGYATSSDLISWQRHDAAHEFVNPPTAQEWDSDMQCYCTVVPFEGRQIMFYVGNGYGFGGIGYAERLGDDATVEIQWKSDSSGD